MLFLVVIHYMRKGGVVMNVLERVYNSSVEVSERKMSSDKAYNKAKNQANQYYKRISDRLAKHEKPWLDNLMACCDAKTERKNVYCFKAGFKTGMSAAIEALK